MQEYQNRDSILLKNKYGKFYKLTLNVNYIYKN